MEQSLSDLRRRRDEATARGDHAEALSLNDAIARVKEAESRRMEYGNLLVCPPDQRSTTE
jgi:hypothetical protein